MEVNQFQCRLCGECCSGEMKVFLNPRDVALLLEYFTSRGETLGEKDLFDRRLLVLDEKNGHRLPRMSFKSLMGVQFCPFLENRIEEDGTLKGLCQLHPDYKPLVCHLAPLTRTIDFDSDQESFGFTPPHPLCPGCGLPDAPPLTPDSLITELLERLEEEKAWFRELWES